jgi:NAD(P)-dependent dehydrogenase (short-subunit alcohol dehydrogenase family)
MKDFTGKTAVVTGAASGIGRALAGRFAAEGMRVVLADVQQDALDQAHAELRESGADAIAVRTDVRKLDEVQALERSAVEAFGKVHILCNNAGVGAGGPMWETTEGDWEWVLGVNLWGVIHGVRTFLPGMIAHGEEGHVVNTASMAGMVAGPFMGPYNVSKFGVVALSETLFHDLRMANANINVSVLCPGFVNTNIGDAARNRPPEYGEPTIRIEPGDARAEMFRQLMANGMPPPQLAGIVFEAICERRFYILTHPDMKPAIEQRMNNILNERSPDFQGFL